MKTVYVVVIEAGGVPPGCRFHRRQMRRLRVDGFVYATPAAYMAHVRRAVGTMSLSVTSVCLREFTDKNNELWERRASPSVVEASSVDEFERQLEELGVEALTALLPED